ncbi:MAG: F0F1 ATP synthase subunit B [Pseudomonadota bacterium]
MRALIAGALTFTGSLAFAPMVALAADEAEAKGGIPTEVWLLLALVVLIAIAYRPASKAIVGGLDGRAEKIRKELDEAHNLREEAKIALANIQRKHRDAMQEAEQITAHAKEEAERLTQQAEEDLAASLKRREAAALERLAQAEAKAVNEVRASAVEAAVRATASLMGSNLDSAKQADLIDTAITELPERLN